VRYGATGRSEDRVELPTDVAVLLDRLRDGLLAREGVVGLYLYGSLTTGDFSPARSDIDVVVMVQREPDKAAIGELKRLHTTLAASGGAAGRLHCLYVPVETAADPERLCTYWFGDRMTQWQLKVLTQAELTSTGVALHGPWPPPGVKPVSTPDLQAAVHQEISGYWRRIARRRKYWRHDSWVDFGLTVLPRAEAVLTAGDLITKGEAIGRLADFGVPATLAEQIRRRRDGQQVTASLVQRLRRARLARRIMRNGVQRLSRLDPAVPSR
jgi:predicted nucleotidyltransferase